MTRKHVDIASGTALLAFSGLLYIGAGALPTRRGGSLVLNTGFYPQLLAIVLAFLSALLLLQAGRKPESREKGAPFWESAGAFGLFALTMGMLCAFPPLMNVLGFGVTCMIFTTVLVTMLSARGQRRPLVILSVSAGITVVIYLVFRMILGIPFPSGLLI